MNRLYFLSLLAFTTFSLKAQISTNPTDSLALVSLYNSTDGANWSNNNNWLTNNVSTWYGVTVDATGRVTRLNLNNNKLRGIIAPEIGDLTELRRLDILNNPLGGIIPNEIGNLTKLTWLELFNNQLIGSIPNTIGNLTDLKNLYLSSNQLTGSIPAELGNLTNLEVVFLSSNKLTGGIPSTIGNLTKLARLFLQKNELTSVPPEIGNLESLTRLDLSVNKLVDIPAEIGSLANLQQLDLFENQLQALPIEIGNLNNLRWLSLNYNQITAVPPEIGDLSNLTQLALGYNQITSIPPEIGELLNLQSLDISYNEVTGVLPSEIGKLTNLMFLILSNNQISGNIPPEIGILAKLNFLYLDNNGFGGNIPVEIGNLTNLQRLYLDNNQFLSIPSEIGNLTALKYLFLNDNQFSDLVDLSNLINLFRLDIQKNRLTFEDIELVLPLAQGSLNYSPQAKVGNEQLVGVVFGNSQTISIPAGSQNNIFQWYKDTVDIGGATDSSYTIPNFSTADTGVYICKINNTIITDLTLESEPITIVEAFNVSASVNPVNSGTVSGTGTYNRGDTVTLSATPTENYTLFINWTENDVEVSREPTNSFVVTENKSFIANFDITTGISLTDTDDSYSVYPNPTKKLLNIKFHNTTISNQSGIKLYLIDKLGRKVELRSFIFGTNEIQTNIRPNSNGIYYLQLIVDNELRTSFTVILTD
jgi:Leucine-rich repeat (LRR) protein